MFLLLSLGGGKGPTPRQGAAPRVEEDTRGGGGCVCLSQHPSLGMRDRD